MEQPSLTTSPWATQCPGSSGRHCSHTQPERLCARFPSTQCSQGFSCLQAPRTAGQTFTQSRAHRPKPRAPLSATASWAHRRRQQQQPPHSAACKARGSWRGLGGVGVRGERVWRGASGLSSARVNRNILKVACW